jgi:hypothetical protein
VILIQHRKNMNRIGLKLQNDGELISLEYLRAFPNALINGIDKWAL